ncbi:hypothetical protein HOH87_03290 [bacterium]|jgi:hypothetical protein|nr:hypothetical protein [bacterium]
MDPNLHADHIYRSPEGSYQTIHSVGDDDSTFQDVLMVEVDMFEDFNPEDLDFENESTSLADKSLIQDTKLRADEVRIEDRRLSRDETVFRHRQHLNLD